VPNSMTVLSELIPVSLVMAQRKVSGIVNFCNPGAISHNEVLALYKQYVDPDYTWSNFTLEVSLLLPPALLSPSPQEQDKILKAKRSNNTLDHTRLCASVPDIHIDDIHTAMAKVMQRMRANLEAEGNYPACLPRRA
jgi:3,5-epimerase/4-reductase